MATVAPGPWSLGGAAPPNWRRTGQHCLQTALKVHKAGVHVKGWAAGLAATVHWARTRRAVTGDGSGGMHSTVDPRADRARGWSLPTTVGRGAGMRSGGPLTVPVQPSYATPNAAPLPAGAQNVQHSLGRGVRDGVPRQGAPCHGLHRGAPLRPLVGVWLKSAFREICRAWRKWTSTRGANGQAHAHYTWTREGMDGRRDHTSRPA